MKELVINTHVFRELFVYARRCLPSEAVALLSGSTSDTVSHFMPLPNLIQGRGFLIHPRDQFDALMALKRLERRLIGTFHSHPDGAAVLSEADIRYLGGWDCLHFVGSIWQSEYRADVIAAFSIKDGTCHSVPFRIGLY